MADFGYTTTPASSESFENGIRGLLAQASTSGTSDSISVFAVDAGSGIHNIQVGIYDSSGNLLGNSASANPYSTTPSWQTISLSGISISASTDYILSAFGSGGAGDFRIYYDSAGSAVGRTEAATFSTWPNPVTWDTSPAQNYGIYCTYTESATFQTAWASGSNVMIGIQ